MNRVKHICLTALAFTALMATISFWAAPRIVAQVRAALVQDVDNAARHFVQVAVEAVQPPGLSSTGLCYDLYTVPNGQRLVVDNFGVRTGLALPNLVTLSQTLTTASSRCSTQGYSLSRQSVVLLPPLFQGTDSRNFNIYGNTQRVQVYADSGQTLAVEIEGNVAFSNAAIFEVTMSGHLVSYP